VPTGRVDPATQVRAVFFAAATSELVEAVLSPPQPATADAASINSSARTEGTVAPGFAGRSAG
jgi:hypothetical protein